MTIRPEWHIEPQPVEHVKAWTDTARGEQTAGTGSEAMFSAAVPLSATPSGYPTWTPFMQARLRTNTVSVWLMAVLGSGLYAWGALAAASVARVSDAFIVPWMAAFVLVSGMVLIFARGDRIDLDKYGIQRLPSAWWALLGPFPYLIARGIRTRSEAGRGWAPTWVAAGCAVFTLPIWVLMFLVLSAR